MSMAIKLHTVELYTWHLCCEEGMQFYCPSHTLCSNSLLINFTVFPFLKHYAQSDPQASNDLVETMGSQLASPIFYLQQSDEKENQLNLSDHLASIIGQKKNCVKNIVCKVTSTIIAIARNSSPNIFCEKKVSGRSQAVYDR